MMKSIVCLTILLCQSTVIAEEAKKEESESVADKAARRFRIHTYEQFRTQREIYDARRMLGDQLWTAWTAAEQADDHLAVVEAWYADAMNTREVDAFPALPELPPAAELLAEDESPEDLQVKTSVEAPADEDHETLDDQASEGGADPEFGAVHEAFNGDNQNEVSTGGAEPDSEIQETETFNGPEQAISPAP